MVCVVDLEFDDLEEIVPTWEICDHVNASC